MKDISINISGKLDQPVIELFQILSATAEQLGISIIVVGATARDLVLHHGFGAAIERATSDVDFGIKIKNWNAFEQLKSKLLEAHFRETKAEHRIISPLDIPVDIVPFGEIQDEKANIAWPSNGEQVMSVLGFQEALENTITVRVSDSPPIDIPVATPEGMAILKLIAWLDRSSEVRPKDAKDLYYLFRSYEEIPAIAEEAYGDQELMKKYGWDLTQACTYKLGMNTRAIMKAQVYEVIANFFAGKHELLNTDRLLQEMCERNDSNIEKKKSLLNAFIEGVFRV